MADTNLKTELTAFVGRQQEVADLRQLITSSRIVTLIGVGGIGKTRLAREAVADPLSDYRDGIWFVDLTTTSSDDAVFQEVLRVVERPVGETFSGTQAERIADILKQRQLLLILDNCEQVKGVVGELILALTQACEGVSILATSRESLGVVGEQLFNVPPMATPGLETSPDAIGETDAVKLFSDRAVLRRFGFEVTADNAADVAELCRRLEGIPLSIELAAARVGALTPADILARLQSSLGLLESDGLGVSERHKSLRRTIDWSYDLLEEHEQILLCRCSVFAGGFDLAAIEHVCSDEEYGADTILNLLTRLVDKSLLTAFESHGHTRYRMLEMIRDYMHELLAQSPEGASMQERHARYFRDFAAAAGEALTGAHEVDWIDRIELELPNLGAAIEWALTTYRITIATDLVLPLCVMQCAFDETVGSWAEMIIDYPHPEQDPRRPGVLLFACYVRFFYRGRTDVAATVRELVDTTRSGDPRLRANVLGLACGLALLNDWPFSPLTAAFMQTALELKDPFHLVHATAARTWGLLLAGEDAVPSGLEVVQLARELRNPSALAVALQAHAMACASSAPGQAVALLDESIAAAASVRAHFTQNVSESMRTTLLFSSLDAPTAVRAILEALESPLGQTLSGLGQLWMAEMAALLVQGGREEAAAVLLGGVSGPTAPGATLWPFTPKALHGALSSLPDQLGPNRWLALTTKGSTMARAELIEFARSECVNLSSSLDNQES